MLKHKTMYTAVAITFALAIGSSLPALAQGPAPASIHGHAQNPVGQALKAQTVKLSKDLTGDLKSRKFEYSFQTDDNGDYKGTGIAPGTYFILLTDGTKTIDYIDNQKFAAGEDKLENFDLTRQAYIDALTPEEKAQIEEYKKKTASVTSTNATIKNLNEALTSTRADLATASPNYDQDVATMKAATEAGPTEPLVWFGLANVLLAKADHLTVVAKAAHQVPQSDPVIQQTYADGIAADEKGITLDAASKKPTAATEATAWNALGSGYAKIGKIPEAQNAYEQAVKLAPTSAGVYYYNEAAVLYNAGNTDAAGAAADKAIAADPARAEAYYIKGQSLIAKATVDKSGKIVAPPGCVDAYQKYLELAPDGPNAPVVRDILTGLGEKINESYKSGKKK